MLWLNGFGWSMPLGQSPLFSADQSPKVAEDLRVEISCAQYWVPSSFKSGALPKCAASFGAYGGFDFNHTHCSGCRLWCKGR